MRALPFLWLCAGLAGCGDDRPDDRVRDIPPPPVAELVSAAAALSGANIPTVDPATLDEAEIRRVLDTGPRCEFRYTSSGKPVLAFGAEPAGAKGVVKLNGKLVALGQAPGQGAPLPPLTADGVLLEVRPKDPPADRAMDGRRRPANLRFVLSQGLEVGYGGYFSCTRGAERPAA